MMLRTDSSVRVVWEPVGPVSSESDMGVCNDESRASAETRKIRQLENAYCLSSCKLNRVILAKMRMFKIALHCAATDVNLV